MNQLGQRDINRQNRRMDKWNGDIIMDGQIDKEEMGGQIDTQILTDLINKNRLQQIDMNWLR